MPYISVYAQLSLKNKLEDHKGLTSESWNFGKDTPLTFHRLAYVIIARLAEFTYATGSESAEEINQGIANLSEMLKDCGIREMDDNDQSA